MHASGMRVRSPWGHRAIATGFFWGMGCYPWLLPLLRSLLSSAVGASSARVVWGLIRVWQAETMIAEHTL